ncbi:multicopper oxidase LPR2 [Trifolium repens]|nr:multicopper oxidase LPR2 [Trifolium repens]
MNSTGNNPSIHPQWQPEYFGDAIIVNGKAWPRLTVRRLVSNETFVGPSEITDVIIDFSQSKSKVAILHNNAAYPYPSGDPVDEFSGKVMKFVILPDNEVDTSRIPEKLVEYPVVDLSSVTHTRYIAMYEYTSDIDEPTHLYLNGKPYEAPVTETPKVGSTEVWYVINLTDDNHPLHIHLGLFKVLDQTELVKSDEFKDCMKKINDAVKCHVEEHARGKKVLVPEYEKGWKNVFKMSPGFVTRIVVRFGYIHTNTSYGFDATAESGYVYHCHILDHEDNAMMRPLKIIK